MDYPNGEHDFLTSKEWRMIRDRVRETHEIARAVKESFMELAGDAHAIRADINEAKNALKAIHDTLLGAALLRSSNQLDTTTHIAVVKSQSRMYGSIILVLITVIGALLLGERFDFITKLQR